MADFHKIRLYQSTWGDAQRLMTRWGAWGSYSGTCSSNDCRYRVELADGDYPTQKWTIWLAHHHASQIYHLFGGRSARVDASFTVHEGSIWRETSGIAVGTEHMGRWYGNDEFPLTLMVETKSRQRLRASDDDWWIMGDEEQLGAHPYYKEGRPGGCKIDCELAVVTYSTHTPPAEMERLSSFDLGCLTRFKPCTELGQLLPAAREWHLYKDEDMLLREMDKAAEKPCAIPLWALARDSRYVLAVKVISADKQKEQDAKLNPTANQYETATELPMEDAQVKIEEFLKGTPPWPVSSLVSAQPYAGTMDHNGPHQQAAEHLRPGGSYIIFPNGDDRRDRVLTRASMISLSQCGVWEDTVGNRRALEEGFAQNDGLEKSTRGANLR